MELNPTERDSTYTNSPLLLPSFKRNIYPKLYGGAGSAWRRKYETKRQRCVWNSGGTYSRAIFFSLDHAEEVHHEAKDRDPVWDCTLIKVMREKGDSVVNPIYEWTDADVWQYIRDNKLNVNPMYECGYSRVGCVLCPLSTYHNKMKDIERYPKYAEAYKRAFQRMLDGAKEKAHRKGEEWTGRWNTGEDVFEWWIEKYKHEVKGQIKLDLGEMQ